MRSRIRRVLRVLVGIVVGTFGLAATGQARGQTLDVAGAPDGGVTLTAGGALVARLPLATPALRRGPVRARLVEVDGHRLAEVRVAVRGTGNEEVWLAELGGRAPRVVWKGLVGPRDADDETSIGLDVSDDGVVEFQTAGPVTRCDGVPVRLFPRAFDFDAGRFRPVMSPVPAAAAATLVARRGDTTMPAGKPVSAFHFTSASTTAGAGDDARALAAPTALDDGDPATAWAEGLGGDGRGEFLTARASGPVAVRGLRILPGDAASAQTFRTHNRVRRLEIAFGPRPDQRFDVELPEDPGAEAGRFRDAYWVALPHPVVASCVTVVLTSVAPGTEAAPPGSFGTTAISELAIFTELDGPEGADHLVDVLAHAADCASRVSTLVSLGAAAVAPTARAVAAAPPGAPRACLVDALTQLEPAPKDPLVVAALVAALAGASEDEEWRASTALTHAPDAPVGALAAALNADAAPDADRARAARVLAQVEAPGSTATLLAAVGRGPVAVREAVVRAASNARRLDLADVLAAFAHAAGTARQADLLRVTEAAARRAGVDAGAALGTLSGALANARPFEVRGRAVEAFGALGAIGVPTLVRVRTQDDEPVLRHLATRQLLLLAQANETALFGLRAALGDRDPRVRETAAAGLGLIRDGGATAALLAGAKQEPWPFVRRAELEALGHLCGVAAGDLLARAVERDVDEVRRVAFMGLARCKDPRAAGLLLRAVGRRNETSTLRELAAGLLGYLGDRSVAPELAASLARQVNESEDDLSVEGVAAATLRALADLGGPEATTAAVTLAKDTRHPLQRAAVEALGVLCDPGAGAATLRALEAGPPGALSLAAQNATKRCANR
jgi:HEAT repeat protein